MKIKKMLIFVMVIIIVAMMSVPIALADESGDEPIEPMTITRTVTVHLGGWSSSAQVPSSTSITYTDGRFVYAGVVSRISSPLQSNQGGWGALFSGTLQRTAELWSIDDVAGVHITDPGAAFLASYLVTNIAIIYIFFQ
ncbi:MAG: hypothetical protein FWC96_06225 [Oscillospiraceae bacterium]|nr:hypothetical protein [Oscillospiraceae bacterium]